MLRPTREDLLGLPKAELHVHLDGSVRPATMIDLARTRGIALPSTDPDVLRRHMVVDDARSLEDYLARFVLTLSVMQDAEALDRTAYELVQDHAAENVRYAEIRFCPALNTQGGLSPDAVLETVLGALGRADAEFGVTSRVIVCALRTLDPSVSVEMAELAVAYRDRGVVGFDLAGAEAGNPVREHMAAFRIAHEAGLLVTVHAGEGFGSPSIHEAVHLARADRIGHGTRLYEDPALETLVRERAVPLEVCLTSNVQTGVSPSYGQHPVGRYFRAGIPVVLGTDNRLMSGVTLTDEYACAHRHLGFGWDDLLVLARNGFRCAFLPEAEKAELLDAFQRSVPA